MRPRRTTSLLALPLELLTHVAIQMHLVALLRFRLTCKRANVALEMPYRAMREREVQCILQAVNESVPPELIRMEGRRKHTEDELRTLTGLFVVVKLHSLICQTRISSRNCALQITSHLLLNWDELSRTIARQTGVMEVLVQGIKNPFGLKMREGKLLVQQKARGMGALRTDIC